MNTIFSSTYGILFILVKLEWPSIFAFAIWKALYYPFSTNVSASLLCLKTGHLPPLSRSQWLFSQNGPIPFFSQQRSYWIWFFKNILQCHYSRPNDSFWMKGCVLASWEVFPALNFSKTFRYKTLQANCRKWSISILFSKTVRFIPICEKRYT